MNKLLGRWAVLSVIFVLGCLVAACGGQETAGEPSAEQGGGSAEEETPTTETSYEPITLTVASVWPGPHGQNVNVVEPLLEEIERVTEGRVKGELYYADALGKTTENYDMAVTGVADFALGLHGYTPGVFHLTGVIELPLISESAEHGSKIYRGLLDAFPEEFAEEHPGTKIAYLFQGDGSHIITVDAPVHKPEDLKGLRLRTPSPAANKVLERFGAIPVSLPMGELYEAMQKGVVDGALAPASAFVNFQLNDVAKYITIANFYGSSFFAVMHEPTWDQISPEDQATLEEVFREYGFLAGKVYDEYAEKGLKDAEEKGLEIYQIPPEEFDEWEAIIEPVIEEWIEEMEAMGKPGREVYEEAIRLRDELK